MTINNLSSILLAALFIISTVSASVSFSQEEVVMDSIITGSKYRITMYNDKEIIGKVAKQDSLYVYMVTDEGTVRIRYEDIFSVSKSTVPRLMKGLFTLGGGVLLQGGDFDDGYRDTKSPGYSMQLTGLYPFSENKAIRIDLSFGRMQREVTDYYYSYGYGTFDPVKQKIDIYNFYAQFLFGDFNTKSKFSVYGIAGVGLMHVREEGYIHTTYNYYDSSYYSYFNPDRDYTNFSMSLGGGLRFKISNRIGAFAEAQYNLTTYQGFLWFFGSGYFPIRAGITYMLY